MNFNLLTGFLDSLPERGIPGVDMTICQSHKSIYRHSAGLRDIEKNQPVRQDDLYYLYSATKLVTCVCALQLYETGAYLMSDPLYEYIPEYRNVTVREHTPDGQAILRPAARPIEIRDLFTMTAGLNYDVNASVIRETVREKGEAVTTLDIARALARQPLSFDPGAHWQYSLCHDVLGALIEVLSGLSLATYAKKHVFEPLGMTSSRFHYVSDMEGRMATQYRFNEAKSAPVAISPENSFQFGPQYDSGGAGMISSVDDYIRFADALACEGVGANGERILSAATIDLMRTNQLTDAQRRDLNWIQMRGYGYGLGARVMIDKAAGGSLGPLGEFGWGGAAGAYVLIDPSRRLSAYFAEHMLGSMEPYVHPRLRNFIYLGLESE